MLLDILAAVARKEYDQLSELAADLIRLKVDVIVAFVTKAAEVAKSQTSTIPIVMVGVADPVGAGLATSLARPGGNVTGTSSMAVALVAKQLELLKLAAPDRTNIAAMFQSDQRNVPNASSERSKESVRGARLATTLY